MADENLRIIELCAENFMRLRAVRFRPKAGVTRIEGKNAAGKSCTLNVVQACLGGKKLGPDEPLRKGASKGTCWVVLGTEDKPIIKAQRFYSDTGRNELKVFDGEGRAHARRPQDILDELRASDLMFDPLKFFFMDPKAQGALLRTLDPKLDFTALDQERHDLYEERTLVNAAQKSAATVAGQRPPRPGDMTQRDVRALADAQQKTIAHNRDVDNAQAAADRAGEEVKRSKLSMVERKSQHKGALSSCREITDKLASLKKRDLDVIQEKMAEAEEHVRALAKERQEAISHNRLYDDIESSAKRAADEVHHQTEALETLDENLSDAITAERDARTKRSSMDLKDAASLGEQIAGAEDHNTCIKAFSDWETRSKEAEAKAKESQGLTDRITAIDAEKVDRLANASFPVDSLSVGEDGCPTLNELPLSAASSRERLIASTRIGLAQKPKARIMCCRDGSLLDASGWSELETIAEEEDCQILVETVADDATPGAIFIVDGEYVEPTEATT